MRDYWRGEPGSLGEFAARLSGSSDLYESDGRAPYASINFVTAHDGFTLHDLVSYNDKHNEANGEDNNDGERQQPVLELRRRGCRPTILRCCALRAQPATQHPRHPAAQPGRADDPPRRRGGPHPAAATTTCTARTTSSPGWTGRTSTRTCSRSPSACCACVPSTRCSGGGASSPATPPSNGLPDIAWLNVDGTQMDHDRTGASAPCSPLAVFLNGGGITEAGLRGEEIDDDSFLLMLNPSHEDADDGAARPALAGDAGTLVLDTGATRRPGGRAAAASRARRRKVDAPLVRRPASLTGHERRRRSSTSTYRLQLHAGFGFADAAASRPLPAPARRLPPLPVAGPAGRARLDARLRRGRPHPRLRRPRRGGRARAALAGAAHEHGMGIVVDVVPEPHGDPDAGAPEPTSLGHCSGWADERRSPTGSTSTGTCATAGSACHPRAVARRRCSSGR